MQLAQYLNKKKLKIADFAQTLETSPGHLSRIIRGERSPSPDLLEKIAKATNDNVKPNDFFPEIVGKKRAQYDGAKPRTD